MSPTIEELTREYERLVKVCEEADVAAMASQAAWSKAVDLRIGAHKRLIRALSEAVRGAS